MSRQYRRLTGLALLLLIIVVAAVYIRHATAKVERSYYNSGALKSISQFNPSSGFRCYDLFDTTSLLKEHFCELNGLREGSYTKYYKNGQVSEKRNYSHGVLSDTILHFSKNGLLEKYISVRDGLQHGETAVFNERGVKVVQNWFHEGTVYLKIESSNRGSDSDLSVSPIVHFSLDSLTTCDTLKISFSIPDISMSGLIADSLWVHFDFAEPDEAYSDLIFPGISYQFMNSNVVASYTFSEPSKFQVYGFLARDETDSIGFEIFSKKFHVSKCSDLMDD